MQGKENKVAKESTKRRQSIRGSLRRDQLEKHFALLRGRMLAQPPKEGKMNEGMEKLIVELRRKQLWRSSFPLLPFYQGMLTMDNRLMEEVTQILGSYLNLGLEAPNPQLLKEDTYMLIALFSTLEELISQCSVGRALIAKNIQGKIMEVIVVSRRDGDRELTWSAISFLLKLNQVCRIRSRFDIFRVAEEVIEEMPHTSWAYVQAIRMAVDADYLQAKTVEDLVGKLMRKLEQQSIDFASSILIELSIPVFLKAIERWPEIVHRIVEELDNSEKLIKKRMIRLLENLSDQDDSGTIFNEYVLQKLFAAMITSRGFKTEEMVLNSCLNLLKNKLPMTSQTKFLILKNIERFQDERHQDVADLFSSIFCRLSPDDVQELEKLDLISQLEGSFPRNGVVLKRIAESLERKE